MESVYRAIPPTKATIAPPDNQGQTSNPSINADLIPYDKRKAVIQSFKSKEIAFHKQLKELFSAMEPSKETVITHGPSEYGKDLVVISRDSISSTARAVIVKCEGVTGKANGPIDTIKSQIDMTFRHPYNPTGKEPVPTVEALVVICGSISNNAKERIQKEFEGKALKFIELGELVKLFTEYYPQVFFGGYAYSYLTDQIALLENTHAFAEKEVPLSRCFVEPTMLESSLSSGKAGKPRKRRAARFKDFKASLSTSKRTVVRGDAGCGKSALMRKLAIDLLSSKCDEVSRGETIRQVPTYVEAKALVGPDGVNGIECDIRSITGMPDDFKIGPLIVDGLDEVRSEFQDVLLVQLCEYATAEGIALIVSTRFGGYFDEATSTWQSFDVEPMNVGQALALCERISADQSCIDTMREGIESIRGNFSLTPLSIFLLLDLVEEHQEIPASLTELFDQYTDTVLGKADKDKGIEVVFEYVMKKRLLASIAYKSFVTEGRDSIDIADFEAHAKRYFEDYEWPLDNWDILVSELRRSCLLVADEPSGQLFFKHRTFLEFFSAYHLHINPDEDGAVIPRVIDLYYNPQWTDIAFYFFGLKKSITAKTLDAVFDRADSSPFALIRKILVGRLLQAAWHSKVPVKRAGVERASSYALAIRKSFLAFAAKEGLEAASVIADMLLISLSAESFGSVFLVSQIQQAINDSDLENDEALLSALCLFAGTAKLMEPSERAAHVETFSQALSSTSDKELEFRGLIYLAYVGEEDDSVKKIVRRRLKSFSRKYPQLTAGMMPKSAD